MREADKSEQGAAKSGRKARSKSAWGRAEVTREKIAERAYEISQSPESGSDEDNWFRAERELQREAGADFGQD
jgi:hypothetical protein